MTSRRTKKMSSRNASAPRRASSSARPAGSPRPSQSDAGLLSAQLLARMPPDRAAEVIKESFRLAARGRSSSRPPRAPANGPLMAPVEGAEANIVDELQKGGPAFGDFVRSVGLAVAEAQDKLDDRLVTTAKALSDSLIDVIAVFEQQVDNDGKMTSGIPIVQKLPLVNYLMPTAYQWSRVFLQADMKVSEFNGANGFNIKGKSSSFTAGASASYGLGGFGASGSARFSTSNFESSGDTSFARDQAVGSLHMEATLEPRGDIQLPRPFVLQKGPRLRLTTGPREPIMDTSTPPKRIGSKVTLTAELRDAANNPLTQKLLDLSLSNPGLDYELSPTDGKTDTNGTLKITVKRQGAAFDENKPPEPVVVRVWLGLIAQEVGINI